MPALQILTYTLFFYALFCLIFHFYNIYLNILVLTDYWLSYGRNYDLAGDMLLLLK